MNQPKTHPNNPMLKKLKSFFSELKTKRKFAKLERKLTEEQRKMVGFILSNFTYKEIGEQLFKSKKTVSTHARNIFLKAGCSSRKEFQKKFDKNKFAKNQKH